VTERIDHPGIALPVPVIRLAVGVGTGGEGGCFVGDVDDACADLEFGVPDVVALDVGLAVDGRAEDPAVPGDGLLCPAAADGEVDVNATGRIPVQKMLGDLYDATR
jgi:hypothetical protein